MLPARTGWRAVLVVLMVLGLLQGLPDRARADSGPPSPPTSVVATASATSTEVAVRWTPAAGGAPATGALLGVWLAPSSFIGSVACADGCTSWTLSGFAPGHDYFISVFATDSAGASSRVDSNTVTVTSGCTSADVCVGVKTTAPLGPALLRGQGFLHGISAATNGPPVTALGPRWWRVANPDEIDAARADHAVVTTIISDRWFDATDNAQDGGAVPPWRDWNVYDNFVRQTVINDAGRTDYWDIQNEPTGPGYYGPSAGASVANVLAQFLHAYQDIKAVNPNAKIVGPSLGIFSQYYGEYGPAVLDLPTFLDFAVANQIHLDAVSWHEIAIPPPPTDWYVATENLSAHVSAARALLAARPALGTPAIFVNEYSPPTTAPLPGWEVGWLAALEASHVDQANHACWGPPNASTCSAGQLDGLFNADGSPAANYWIHHFYAAMSGTVVSTGTSDARTTAVSAVDGTGVIRVLLGRHEGCTAEVNPACNQPASATPPPASVSLSIGVPAPVPYQVTIQQIPNQRGTVIAPVPVSSSTVTSGNGQLVLSLPNVADGDAYSVTIVPPVLRLGGSDRIATAIAVSQHDFAAGGAHAVVLSRSDDFADALAGGPLATAKQAPLLLTATDTLDGRVADEVKRVLPPGAAVYLLGGPSAIGEPVAASLRALGYTVVRYGGTSRFETAAIVATDGLSSPATILLATGRRFPDALAGAPAAARLGAAILLTDDNTMPAPTAAYLAAHHPTVFALGGPAAGADPAATPLVGKDRYQTAAVIASRWFASPTTVGFASGANFPDALSGGAALGLLSAPMLLVDPAAGALPADVTAYLNSARSNLASGLIFGGENAVPSALDDAAQAAVN